MKLKKSLYGIGSFVLATVLTSCASYSASPLCDPSPDLVYSAPKNEGVSIVSKAFTLEDCYKFLDRDVLAEGYQPVQIYIQNDSDKRYIFSLNRLNLPVARTEEVADKVHTSTVGRVVGYSVGALFLSPLVIPAIVDGIKSSNANKALDHDFLAKAARDQIVFPHSRINSLIFVPSQSYQNFYTITLIDQDSSQPIVFNVTSQN